MPTFSIVVLAHGADSLAGCCLDSLDAQTLDDWEAVVVDDGTSDGGAGVAATRVPDDARVRVLPSERGRGIHGARLAGARACTGERVLFLDADDELADSGVLASLAELPAGAREIVRLGDAGVEPTASDHGRGVADALEEPPARVDRDELLRLAFEPGGGHAVPWHITRRLYPRELLLRACDAMTGEELGRAADAYEFLVLAGLSQGERLVAAQARRRHDVVPSGPIGPGELEDEAGQVHAGVEAARAFARSEGDAEAERAARGMGVMLEEAVADDWLERVTDDGKASAARAMADAFGPADCARELWRLVRDSARDDCARGATEPSEATGRLRSLAVAAYEQTWDAAGGTAADRAPLARCDEMRSEALAALDGMDHNRTRAGYEAQDLRIFVTTHKPVQVPRGSVFQPVQVGPGTKTSRFGNSFHDDEGDNISALNPSYCEMTTQYWAWKNTSSEYVGFCHYRRYFSFSDTPYKENAYGEVMDDYIDADAVARYGLDDEHARRFVEGFDIVTTAFHDLRSFPGAFSTPREHYAAAPLLNVADLDRCMDIVRRLRPDFAPDVEAFLAGHRACFCNMYVLRRSLFDDYCSFVFPVLEEFCREADMTHYGREALRTPGHLAERLFNVWYLHERRTHPGLRTRELQCVHFASPEPASVATPAFGQHGVRPRDVVPVVFAADDAYVPQLCCAMGSMMENASPERFYDVYVLNSGISAEREQATRAYLSRHRNLRLSFVDVTRLVHGHKLGTNNAHISQETYYRFLVQQILPFYDKVVYLDSDLVVEGDVAQLFDTELGDDLVAATRDVDYLGNLNTPGGDRMAYTQEVLGLRDPYAYFQAGVLVLNTAALRSLHTVGEWLTIADNPVYIYNDQDILNVACEGRVSWLDASWNVTNDIFDRVGRIYALAPADAFDAYQKARSHPQVVHFAGAIKPWHDPTIDLAGHFWRYARETPFYEELLCDINAPARKRKTNKPLLSDGNPLRRIVDPVAPLGSPQREILKRVGRTLTGRK